MKPVVLGIAGGTGSGKTTVAEAVIAAVGAECLAFLAADSYYRDIEWTSEAHLLAHNFDHPSALDSELLATHIRKLKADVDIAVPIYDFVRHRRMTAMRPVEARPVVIVEGILILALPEIRELLDLKIFVDTEADLRLIRRIRRDLEERGRPIEDVLRQYEQTVRAMHREFVEPSKEWADVIIPQGGHNKAALELVIARVEQLISASSRKAREILNR
ncbi:MAG: uridine kinase [bacterium]|nr:uridine kinase [bacterium]